MPLANIAALRERLKGSGRNPRVVARAVLGTLVAANLIAAVVVFKPWAGSAEELERQAASLRKEVRQKQIALDKLRGIVSKVETARTDGDRFMGGYLLGRRSVSSRLAGDLDKMAGQASIRQREIAFAFEPVEGSDTLTKATMTSNYEGTYSDLMHFLNLLDRSPRLLIIESLAATPQPQGLVLNITMKVNAFVREGAGIESDVAAQQADDNSGSAEPQAPRAPVSQASAEAEAAGGDAAMGPPPPPAPQPAAAPQILRQLTRPMRGPRAEGRSQ